VAVRRRDAPRTLSRLGCAPGHVDGVEGTASRFGPQRAAVSGRDWNRWDAGSTRCAGASRPGGSCRPGAPGARYKYELLGPTVTCCRCTRTHSPSLPSGGRPTRPSSRRLDARVARRRTGWRSARRASAATRRSRSTRSTWFVEARPRRGRPFPDLPRTRRAARSVRRRPGFTHLELLPITEHPFDLSWAIRRRAGSPDQPVRQSGRLPPVHRRRAFRRDGVILDWCRTFPDDAYGLARFRGTALYEHADAGRLSCRVGTFVFNLGAAKWRTFCSTGAVFGYGNSPRRSGVDAVARCCIGLLARGRSWFPMRSGDAKI